MKKSVLLKIVLLFEIILLCSTSIVINRDYQDNWILEGIFPFFIIFSFTYVITYFSEEKEMWTIFLAIIYHIVVGILPNLKYFWFYGAAIDQHGQYLLAKEVYNNGYIPTYTSNGHSDVYITTPIIHLSLSIFTIILNTTVNISMKFVPLIISIIPILLTYSIIKTFDFPYKEKLIKYSVFLSSLPINADSGYIITGRTYGFYFLYLLIFTMLQILCSKDKRYWFLFVILSITLTLTHTTSSLLFAALLILLLTTKYIKSINIHYQIVMINTIISLSWLIFFATRVFIDMKDIFLYTFTSQIPNVGYIPTRFFNLIFIDFFSAIRSMISYNGVDILLLFTSTITLIYIVKNPSKFNDLGLNIYLRLKILLLIILISGIGFKIGGFFYVRVLSGIRIFYPVFFSIFILHLIKHRSLKIIIIVLLMILSPIQYYDSQPIISAANVISENLPMNEPLDYTGYVNSIYQRNMIKFSENYALGRIACDSITRSQIIGLTQINYSKNLLWYYPIINLVYKDTTKQEYDYYMIHTPGKSGPFEEQAELRTKKIILYSLINSNIIFSNSESYICTLRLF